jgi:pilus assembly protein CpaB
MNTKKIWLSALIFGIFATGVFYVAVMKKDEPAPTSAPASNEAPQEEMESKDTEKAEAEKKDNEKATASEDPETEKNEMLPVKEGKRAISVQIDEVNGVSGFVSPGAYVDLVTIVRPPEESGENPNPELHEAATLLLQNVRVLAVGHAADTKEETARYRTVTLEVNPEEGLALGFATKGEFYLMLREEGDNGKKKDNLHYHEEQLHKGVF